MAVGWGGLEYEMRWDEGGLVWQDEVSVTARIIGHGKGASHD